MSKANDFFKLVVAVGGIDEDAAKYLANEVPAFRRDGNLGRLFIWATSPQGDRFWRNIYNILNYRRLDHESWTEVYGGTSSG